METGERAYLPAADHDWALPLYDIAAKLFGMDVVREMSLNRADIESTDRVLDVGCGTGTLAVLVKQRYPEAHVTGLDPDPRALVRARRKAARSGASTQFDHGFSDNLPYPDGFFDHVFSSFMFHHLAADERERTLHEVRRALKQEGVFHLVDFDSSDDNRQGWLARSSHFREHLKGNSEKQIAAFMSRAGFLNVTKIFERTVLFGGLRTVYLQAFGRLAT